MFDGEHAEGGEIRENSRLVAAGLVFEESYGANGLLRAARHRQRVHVVAVAHADACAGALLASFVDGQSANAMRHA